MTPIRALAAERRDEADAAGRGGDPADENVPVRTVVVSPEPIPVDQLINGDDGPSFRDLVAAELRAVEEMLVAKNAAYGNSALDPVRIFSRADPVEQLRVRIDDKLSRLMRGQHGNTRVEQATGHRSASRDGSSGSAQSLAGDVSQQRHRAGELTHEDTERDLIGYLVLLRIARASSERG